MSNSIIDKTYKKLAIQVALDGLSFGVFDTLNSTPLLLKHVPFTNSQRSAKIEEIMELVYHDNPELKHHYDEIAIIHSNNLSTFVPTALFDEEFIGSYLQYNTKVFETDFFTFDALENYEMNHVYIPYVNMNNFFIDQYGSFDYKHAHTILVSRLLDLSKNKEERKMFVNVSESHFEIIVVQNQKLLLFNSFEYKTPEDFIYYILFTAEQLQLNPENFQLELLGAIQEDNAYYKIAYQYIRNVSLLDVSDKKNTFTDSENREFFILIHS
ncbi:MAG: hypothetical protein RIQ59_1968 [Bacteroidota bacterium]|jgi:hypothetical protein